MRKYVDSYEQASTLMAERGTSVIPVFLALTPVDIELSDNNTMSLFLLICQMSMQGFMTSKLVNQSFTERKKKLCVNNKSTLWSYP